MAIGVAVADSPAGPFKDALGKPLITTSSWSNIDPTVYIDTDGQAYLYWGNGNLYYVKLDKGMVTYSGDIVQVPQTAASFGGVRGKSPNEKEAVHERQKDVYVEGPWFYERSGKYYMMYAGITRNAECLSYSMSDHPTGPWTYKGKIMTEQPTNSFTNHGGIIDFKGKSYLFYHTGLLPHGGSYGRSTAIEEFKYNDDGTIPEIAMTKEGVQPVGKLDPFKRVEAETIAWSEKCGTAQNEGSVYVNSIRTGGYIKVRSVDFGTVAPKTFSATVASGLDGGVLEVHIDSVAGTTLAAIDVPRTGGWQSWKTISDNVKASVNGTHDVYFVFKGKNITAGRELFNFDWWIFKK
jgi:beta-xylosidase